MVLKIFTSELPNEPKLVLYSRNPLSLLTAKEMLIETEYFYKKTNDQNAHSSDNNKNKNFNYNRNRKFTNSQLYSQSITHNSN